MNRVLDLRRWLIAAVVAAFAVTLTAFATPASAAVSVSWSTQNASGTVTFTSSHSYTIRTTIYNPYSTGSVGAYSQGQYFAGNGRYACGSTPTRTNSAADTVRTWTDSTNCSIANIHTVMIVENRNGSAATWIYVDNPLS